MVLVKWLALCAIGERKKERGGEEKKKRNAIAIIIPFDRRDIGEIIQSCYFVRERRIVASTTSIGGPKIPQMLENRVERRWKKGEVWEGMGKKKADENWPGIDRDRWHLTWHLTNCEISLLRTGIIADQRSIYFSLPRYSLAPPPTAPQEPDRNWKFNFSPPSHPSFARHPDELNGERTAVRGKNAIVFLPRSPWSKNSFERTQESLLMRPLNRRNNSLKVEQKFIIKYH